MGLSPAIQGNQHSRIGEAVIALGGGFLLGGPVGLAAGALLLPGCDDSVRNVGVINNKPNEEKEQRDETSEKKQQNETRVVITSPKTITNNVSIDWAGHRNILTWTGSEYGMTWVGDPAPSTDNYQIFFARFDEKGDRIGAERQVTFVEDANTPTLVWNASLMEYVIAWGHWHKTVNEGSPRTQWEVWLSRLDSNGNKISEDRPVLVGKKSSFNPFLAWNEGEEEYGLAWYAGNIRFTRLDTSGNPIGATVDVTDPSSRATRPYLFWEDGQYILNWREPTEDDTVRIHLLGMQDMEGTFSATLSSGLDVFLFPTSFTRASGEYGLAWYEDGEINFAHGEGEKFDTAPIAEVDDFEILRLSHGSNGVRIPGGVSLAWNGEEYGISWGEEQSNQQIIHFARVDSHGGKIGDVVPVTSNPRPDFGDIPSSFNPTLIAAEGDYGIVWAHREDHDAEYRFAKITLAH